MTGGERVLRAELRQEAAEEGRMAMRARMVGADPRHYDLDQAYYQRLSEGHAARYPSAEHEALMPSWVVICRGWRNGRSGWKPTGGLRTSCGGPGRPSWPV